MIKLLCYSNIISYSIETEYHINMHINIQLIYKKLISILITLITITNISILISGCNSSDTMIQSSDFKLNTFVSITAYGTTQAIVDDAIALCDYYENIFSRTKNTGTVYKVNNRETNIIPPPLAELIEYGIEYANLSDGAFDISIGSISSLWDFTASNPTIPHETQIADNLPYVNFRDIALTPCNDESGNYTISIPKGMMLDVGAIAKGYIADKIKDYLIEQKVESAIINLGGNVLCIGSKPDKSAYNVAIKKPFGENNEAVAFLKIKNSSVVSSGTYERCFTLDNKLYHHILNPRTGYPYDNSLTSVTILSDLSVTGDCLSTVCFTLGLQKGMELIENTASVEAIFITEDGALHYSSGADKYISQ